MDCVRRLPLNRVINVGGGGKKVCMYVYSCIFGSRYEVRVGLSPNYLVGIVLDIFVGAC